MVVVLVETPVAESQVDAHQPRQLVRLPVVVYRARGLGLITRHRSQGPPIFGAIIQTSRTVHSKRHLDTNFFNNHYDLSSTALRL